MQIVIGCLTEHLWVRIYFAIHEDPTSGGENQTSFSGFGPVVTRRPKSNLKHDHWSRGYDAAARQVFGNQNAARGRKNLDTTDLKYLLKLF